MKLAGGSQLTNEVTIYICSICKDYFDDTTNIINHIITIHKDENNVQQILQNGLPKDINKNNFKIKKINGIYRCTECSYVSKFLTTIKRHIFIHKKGSITYKCKFCSFSTIQSFNLNLHVKKLHPDGKPEVKIDPIVAKEMLKKYTDG